MDKLMKVIILIIIAAAFITLILLAPTLRQDMLEHKFAQNKNIVTGGG